MRQIVGHRETVERVDKFRHLDREGIGAGHLVHRNGSEFFPEFGRRHLWVIEPDGHRGDKCEEIEIALLGLRVDDV